MMKRFAGMIALLIVVGVSSTGCHNACRRGCNNCGQTCGPTGCRPGPIGWQRGGTDYQRFLSHEDYRNPAAASGVTAAQTAYPYYTNRGPRDFLVNNPPTIGR